MLQASSSSIFNILIFLCLHILILNVSYPQSSLRNLNPLSSEKAGMIPTIACTTPNLFLGFRYTIVNAQCVFSLHFKQFIFNSLCTLLSVPFSIPKTLTKMRKKYGASFENLFCIAGIDRIHIYSTSNNT